jgi:hypothetical protein
MTVIVIARMPFLPWTCGRGEPFDLGNANTRKDSYRYLEITPSTTPIAHSNMAAAQL